MITKLKIWFSSIIFKLFISFWFIALLSITITRLISTQLSDDGVILPAHQEDLMRLQFVTRIIENRPPANIGIFLQRLQKRMGKGHKKPVTIWAKNINTKILYSSTKNRHRSLASYLEKNSFTDVVSVQFPYARITGPINISIANNGYQLYITSKNRNPDFRVIIMQMPAWTRVTIPLIISLIICWLLARSLTKPLLTIKNSATRIGDGDLSIRVESIAKREDELGELAKSFNQMAEKLEQNLTAQQRLLGDISHELRSPMTRLQMALGLAQKTPLTTAELAKYLQRCELEVERLDNMISDTLVLSRLENSIQPLNLDKINIYSLMTLLIEDAQFLANEKSVTISCSDLGSLQIMADSQLLSAALSNILTNAVKYSPEHGDIFVSITTNNSETISLGKQNLVIAISDEGAGVPQASINQLFEPFYRVVEARDRQTGGTGLGLAIAKQAILAHQGKIFANNNENNGLTVIITLPCKDQ
ncbi:MAG: ATP-binding protein [Colwellia sp.]|nr:ATP-binding protein [Colwellia sp.]